MQSHIAVVGNPYYAISDADGKFTIADLPPGNYTVKIWHEYLGEKTQSVTVAPKTDVTMNLDLKDLYAAKQPAVPPPSAAPSDGKADAKSAPAADKKASGSEIVVHMVSEGSAFKFEPAEITIKAGTTVKWVNDSENRHTATGDPQFEKQAGQVQLPNGVPVWGSPFIGNGETFSQTFTVPGKYQYMCRNHGQFGMEATITVVP
jgi:plastocyanin